MNPNETAVNPNDIGVDELNQINPLIGTTNAPLNSKPIKKPIKLELPIKNQEAGYTLEQVAIEKPEPGFKYWTIKWGNGAESLDQDFEKLVAHYGKETLMTVVSSQLRFALRGKAKFSIPDVEGDSEEDTNRKQAAAMVKFFEEHPDNVILTQEDALAYRPGTKERTSWMGLLQQAKIAKKELRFEDAKELVRQANELMAVDFDMEPSTE